MKYNESEKEVEKKLNFGAVQLKEIKRLEVFGAKEEKLKQNIGRTIGKIWNTIL
jgi:hypothetical protein